MQEHQNSVEAVRARNTVLPVDIDIDENGRPRPIIMTGKPGTGKTKRAKYLLPGLIDNKTFVRIPMGDKDKTDFGTYPVPMRAANPELKSRIQARLDSAEPISDAELNRFRLMEMIMPATEPEIRRPLSMETLRPLLKQNIGDTPAVLLLDDVTTSGDPQLQSAILELAQFGRIDGHELGPNVVIVMSGNGIGDGCNAVDWNKALLSRSILIHHEAKFDEWLNYEDNLHIDSVVVAFLKSHPETFQPDQDSSDFSDENGKTPTPRDWTSCGLNLTRIGGFRQFRPTPMFDTIQSKLSGTLGHRVGAMMAAFAKDFGVFPDPEKLLDNPDLWREVPADRRSTLGGLLGTAHGLRSEVVRRVEGDEKITKKKHEELANKLLDVLQSMTGEPEVFVMIYAGLMQWEKNLRDNKQNPKPELVKRAGDFRSAVVNEMVKRKMLDAPDFKAALQAHATMNASLGK